jgi:proton-translocating NADH-quinone oxidoreductase chain N
MNAELAWAVVFPLLGAVFSWAVPRALARWASGAAIVGLLFAAAAVANSVRAHGVLRHRLGGWGASLGIDLRADGVAAVMLLATAVVGALVTVLALGQDEEARGAQPRFASLWFFAWAALNALVLSADVFNLYVSLELMTLAAVGLIAMRGSREALEAALRYLLFALPGSLVYLLGVAALYGAAGTLDLEALGARLEPRPATGVALALMTLGLCLKAALFPLHGWLPPAYVSSSPPVSALLAALVGKGAFLVLVRVWFGLMPAAFATGAGQLLGALAAGAILWGSVLALGQGRLKPLIAYSSVAQIGYLFLVFPLATRAGLSGGIYLAISHAAAKASLFLAVGTIERAIGRDELVAMRGLAQDLPITFFSLALAGVSLMGMPPSGGFVAKWLLLRAALESGQWLLAAVILLGGLLAAGYVFKILRGAFLPPIAHPRFRAPPRGAEAVPLALALFAFALGLLPGALLELLQVGLAP